ncbi:transposase [Blastopirellula sp. JC732]|uniref:Transposase n=2 Tax=Blastopirellula sediminis TaxID=2894196 RepID=A0A9X1MQG9_9BACT|nr:transposase [Blastopirellula sediminis]MCC9606545.1 transposase [Blastopirellula sediminis]MCC9630157.1 transposase [Blastopirellula sediminis]
MKETVVHLAQPQRALVEHTIREHCEIRDWTLLAVNCRSNHVHVVVHCKSSPHEVLRQLKQWTTRRLNEQYQRRTWWSERGSGRYLYDQTSLESAVVYVRDAQDRK